MAQNPCTIPVFYKKSLAGLGKLSIWEKSSLTYPFLKSKTGYDLVIFSHIEKPLAF